jgi:hypothetical protein
MGIFDFLFKKKRKKKSNDEVSSIPPTRSVLKKPDTPTNEQRLPKKARFVTDKSLVEVQHVVEKPEPVFQGVLGDMYDDLLARGSKPVREIAIQEITPDHYIEASKVPQVYYPSEADLESHAASVVDTQITEVDDDCVIALFDFNARSEREMSISKGDIITVQKRQGTWIFGSKPCNTVQSRRHTRGPPQSTVHSEYGWVPVAFVTKFTTS